MNGVAEIVGGVEDHVHLLVSMRPMHRISDVLRDLKKDSTNWVRANFDRSFIWQEGYSVFTVSPSNLKGVRNYIANQKSHHAKRSYVEELRGLFARAEIEYEEKHLL